MCELCQFWKLNGLRRQNSLQGGALRHRRLVKHVPAKLMQCGLDTLGVAFSGLGLGRRRYRSEPLSNPASQDRREQIALVVVTRIHGRLAYAGRLRDRVDGCAVKPSLHEEGGCNVEQPRVTPQGLLTGGTAAAPPDGAIDSFNSLVGHENSPCQAASAEYINNTV